MGRVKLLATLLPIFMVFVAYIVESPTAAVSGRDWKAGNIITDPLFFDGKSMSVSDIQMFLNSQVPVCDTWGTKMYNATQTRAQFGTSIGVPPPYICVKDYYENPNTRETNFNPTATIPAGAKSAAQIIYDASVAYNINPKVILVTIKKEAANNILGDDWPWTSQYRSITGYGCPDTAPCDSQYYGFYNQVTKAAWQFRLYANYPNSYRHKPGSSNFIQYNPNSACGGSVVFVENQATAGLYNYTPYQPNSAALANMYGHGDSCSAYGNRNFWRIWTDWFGPTSGPAAFTVAGSNTIYMPVNSYKVQVPQMAVMQDYGISPESVREVSQEYVDSIPTPLSNSGLSSSISSVVKTPSDTDADGGAVYLASVGRLYRFQSMSQFYAYGFKEGDIRYLPIEYILSRPSRDLVSNFAYSPNGSIFEIDLPAKQKRLIFEYNTYRSLNPSDSLTPLSYYLANNIPSGNPIVDRPVLIKYATSETVVLYTQSTKYYAISTYDELKCWGLESTLKTPIYRIAQDDYILQTNPDKKLSCLNSNGTVTSLLRAGSKIDIPVEAGITAPEVDADIAELYNKIPSRSTPLSQYIKTTGSDAVLYLKAGTHRNIPTYSTFQMLGLKDSDIDIVPQTLLDGVTPDGILLADGQLIKSHSSPTVYVVSSNGSRYSFNSSDIFLSYKNSWNRIISLDQNAIDKNYPSSGSVSPVVVNKSTGSAYLVGVNECYLLEDTSKMLGKSIENLSSTQSYDSLIFKNMSFSNCKKATQFLKSPSSSLVYWVEGGRKLPLTTYPSMLQKNNGAEPMVITIDPLYLASIPNTSQ